jgi:hypothetical protein
MASSVKSFTEYRLPKDAYTSFDAVSLKQLMTDLLNQNEVFRDQNFEGSNLNSLMDMMAVSYHVLLFYLNNTSSESTFTAASLKENVIKITSLLNYKPIGPQTSVVNFSLSGTSSLPANIYTIKRFASINANGYSYSTLDDISFEKTTSDLEALAINNTLLYQGSVKEYPQFTAVGEEFEVVYLINSNTTNNQVDQFVADNSFTVYVKDVASGLWSQWSEVATLFESNTSAQNFEKKINENGNFEFKFGSGINGRKLKAGDKVQIYYVYSDGEAGKVTQGAFDNGSFNVFTSPIFNEICDQIYTDEENFVTPAQLKFINVSNSSNSSNPTDMEDVDSIKSNATKLFSTQNRLVTLQDYENYINKNYSNVVESVKCINNDTFTSKYLKYFYDIGLRTPLDDGRVLLNQVDFASSTNFNNIYVFTTPKIQPIIDNKVPNYVSQSIKQLIINTTRPITMTTHNVVCADPIYKAFSFGLQLPGETESVDLAEQSRLIVVRDNSSRINSSQIKNRIVTIITDYFSNLKLNDVVDLFVLNASILNIEGVKNTLTRRIDTGYEAQKLNFAVWNPLYPLNDILFTSQNYQLQEYEYAFLYDTTNLSQQIIVEDE